jgi:hypothetical protein
MVHLLLAPKLTNTCVQLKSSNVTQAPHVCSLVSGENLIVQHICQDMMPGTFVMFMSWVDTLRAS